MVEQIFKLFCHCKINKSVRKPIWVYIGSTYLLLLIAIYSILYDVFLHVVVFYKILKLLCLTNITQYDVGNVLCRYL